MKRFLAVFLALVVCLGIIVPASAASNTAPVITGINSGTVAAGGIVHITGKNFLVENTNIASLSVFLFHDDGGANMLASVSNGRYIEWSQNNISFRVDKDTVPQSGELVVVVNNVYGKWGERFSIVAPGGTIKSKGPLKAGTVTRTNDLLFAWSAGQPKPGVLQVFVYASGPRIDGAEIHLSFDPKKVKITNAKGQSVAHVVVPFLPRRTVSLNQVDNAKGTVDFALQYKKAEYSGTLATFYVKTIDPNAQLRFVFDETRGTVTKIFVGSDDVLNEAPDAFFKVQQ